MAAAHDATVPRKTTRRMDATHTIRQDHCWGIKRLYTLSWATRLPAAEFQDEHGETHVTWCWHRFIMRYHVLRPAVNLGKPNFKVAVAMRRITSSQFPSKTGVGSVFSFLKWHAFWVSCELSCGVIQPLLANTHRVWSSHQIYRNTTHALETCSLNQAAIV